MSNLVPLCAVVVKSECNRPGRCLWFQMVDDLVTVNYKKVSIKRGGWYVEVDAKGTAYTVWYPFRRMG